MSKSKTHNFTADMLSSMVADINMALAGVAQKYNVELTLDGTADHRNPSINMVLQAVPQPAPDKTATDRIAAMIAALPSAHVKHFPKMSLVASYCNGDHTYKIIGYNSKAREHKLLMQNIETDELFRFSIEQVSEFKVIKPKRTKK